MGILRGNVVGLLTVHRLTSLLLAWITLCCVSSLGLVQSRAQVEPMAVIVGSQCTVSDISMDDLARLYRGTPSRNADGNRFAPLSQPPESPVRIRFDQVVLGMTPDQAKSFWIDQKIRAAGTEPRVITSVALTVKLVSVLAGAIAYVPASAVSVGVKVVKVQGKLPGQAGYPLR